MQLVAYSFQEHHLPGIGHSNDLDEKVAVEINRHVHDRAQKITYSWLWWLCASIFPFWKLSPTFRGYFGVSRDIFIINLSKQGTSGS